MQYITSYSLLNLTYIVNLSGLTSPMVGSYVYVQIISTRNHIIISVIR